MIGGQVGITLMPIAHDKVQILNHLDPSVYKQIKYFGDKYENGGNDYDIMSNNKVIAHPVNSLQDTLNTIKILLK
jgi:phosphomannomutase